MKENKLITISRASEILGMHQDTLRRWDDEGKLKAIKTAGGHRRYNLRDINDYIEQRDMKWTIVLPKIVDKYFISVSDGPIMKKLKRGQILQEVGSNVYLVRYFCGKSDLSLSAQQLVPSNHMAYWLFFDTKEDMDLNYDD